MKYAIQIIKDLIRDCPNKPMKYKKNINLFRHKMKSFPYLLQKVKLQHSYTDRNSVSYSGNSIVDYVNNKMFPKS